jgi:hypothetical protein
MPLPPLDVWDRVMHVDGAITKKTKLFGSKHLAAARDIVRDWNANAFPVAGTATTWASVEGRNVNPNVQVQFYLDSRWPQQIIRYRNTFFALKRLDEGAWFESCAILCKYSNVIQSYLYSGSEIVHQLLPALGGSPEIEKKTHVRFAQFRYEEFGLNRDAGKPLKGAFRQKFYFLLNVELGIRTAWRDNNALWEKYHRWLERGGDMVKGHRGSYFMRSFYDLGRDLTRAHGRNGGNAYVFPGGNNLIVGW